MIIGVTGHRPEKLFKENPFSRENEIKLIGFAKDQLFNYQMNVFMIDKVITGMALGWDQAIASACVLLKIPFVAAIPFVGQEKAWPEAAQIKYQKLLSYAADQHIVSDAYYSAYKMQVRNEWIVKNSDKMFALFEGSDGGTKNCLDFARRQNKEIINCWDEWIKYEKI